MPETLPADSSRNISHITVCICTYKRPEMLFKLLSEIEKQSTENEFSISIVVVDNDYSKSAQSAVSSFMGISRLKIVYVCEEEQNIAIARNRAINQAEGQYLAFIDDDEIPEPDWLLCLFRHCLALQADGILGPVLPYFETPPPEWIIKGKIFERPSHPSGHQLNWKETRTGNVLFRREIFLYPENHFNPIFGSGGEDRDFFKRMIEKGYCFFWCPSAVVHEIVKPNRWKLSVLLRRALLRGQLSIIDNKNNASLFLKSLSAVFVYIIVLFIFLILLRKNALFKYLINFGDHIGRIFAYLGIRIIKEKYIT